ncbi:MAG: SagB/ThcOx family dehydrogenase [Dehalococcoidia bacterium]|nr:SagB/ThcOx family dehydrogenase [Dehalococcoidia bacterium]
MLNSDIEGARKYHSATKHSYESVRTSLHRMDWEIQPLPFKIYKTLEPLPLPRQPPISEVPALAAIADEAPLLPSGEAVPDLMMLSRLLYFSNGVTKHRKNQGGEHWFRAAACTGALYHIELYLVCGALPGLEAGVYHFSAHDLALRRLRAGDFRGVLVQATGGDHSVAAAPAIVVSTGTFWRNAWKYQARSYRHSFWDSGTILANLLAVAAAHRLPARVVAGFADSAVNALLGLDEQREVALEVVPLGYSPSSPAGPSPQLEPLDLPTEPLSKREVDYPLIREMHGASCLTNAEEAAAWHGAALPAPCQAPTGALYPLALAGPETPTEPVEQVILRRGSTRQFALRSVTFQQLSLVLDRAARGIPADFLGPGGHLNDLYLIVHAVDDLPPGAYVFHRDRRALELLKEGAFRGHAAHLGLGQELPGDASFNVYMLCDLERALGRFGNRGYRAAELEAGIIGGRLYLGAYAVGLGASGLTFYDDDVTAFFSPHAEGKSVMFLVAVGKSAKLPRP